MEHKKRNSRVRSEPIDASFIIEAPTPLTMVEYEDDSDSEVPEILHQGSDLLHRLQNLRVQGRPVQYHSSGGSFIPTSVLFARHGTVCASMVADRGARCGRHGVYMVRASFLGNFHYCWLVFILISSFVRGLPTNISQPNTVFGTRENMALTPLAPRLLHPFSNLRKVARHSNKQCDPRLTWTTA